MNVLILYTELAGYVLGNIKLFLEQNPSANLLLVHYPVNKEAPFKIDQLPRTTLIEYHPSSHDHLIVKVQDFKPDIILCSGWGNKFYLRLLNFAPKNSKKVVCFDNQWKSTFKQHLLILLSRFFILNKFQYAWVPGTPQENYAIKLGFKKEHVFTGLYPADSNRFLEIGQQRLKILKTFPKVFLSVARYIPQKDLPTLWKAFIKANEKTGNRWVLRCIGLGEEFNSRIENAHIEHLGFKQPNEIGDFIQSSGVFVLPSIEEPWGVAVHEMALSGLPLVLSDKVGASTMFLNGSNGYTFPAGDVQALEEILTSLMRMEDHELFEMSRNSMKCGKQLLSEDWSKTLLKILNS